MALHYTISPCPSEISPRPQEEIVYLEKIPATGKGMPPFYDGDGHTTGRI